MTPLVDALGRLYCENIKIKKGSSGMKKIMAGLLLGVLLSGCATTHQSDIAGTGKPETDTQKGVRYLLGHGVEQSYEQAFYYFNQAANNDDPVAENEVAYLYATGKGTAQDREKAFKFYMAAANHGLVSAQYSVGFCYLHGFGVAADKAEAQQWFEKAAARGFEPAKVALTQL